MYLSLLRIEEKEWNWAINIQEDNLLSTKEFDPLDCDGARYLRYPTGYCSFVLCYCFIFFLSHVSACSIRYSMHINVSHGNALSIVTSLLWVFSAIDFLVP